jgi:hypothetical protein
MNAERPIKKHKRKSRVPMYQSTWVALFLLLRHEWLSLRPGDKLP